VNPSEINLASRPFQKTRSILVISLFSALALIILFAGLIALNLQSRSEGFAIRGEIGKLESELRDLRERQADAEEILRRPEYAEVLEQSVFFNSLLVRKGISWTRIFSDLTTVTPYDVRLIRIRPQVDLQNKVYLDMVVASADTTPVIRMLRNMEGSERFGPTQLHSSLPPTELDPVFRYRVSVRYAQELTEQANDEAENEEGPADVASLREMMR
jgi:hypothetical protein